MCNGNFLFLFFSFPAGKYLFPVFQTREPCPTFAPIHNHTHSHPMPQLTDDHINLQAIYFFFCVKSGFGLPLYCITPIPSHKNNLQRKLSITINCSQMYMWTAEHMIHKPQRRKLKPAPNPNFSNSPPPFNCMFSIIKVCCQCEIIGAHAFGHPPAQQQVKHF